MRMGMGRLPGGIQPGESRLGGRGRAAERSPSSEAPPSLAPLCGAAPHQLRPAERLPHGHGPSSPPSAPALT